MKAVYHALTAGLFLGVAFWTGTAAGQDVAYTQYYLNMAGVNPGFTGIEDYVDVKVGFRQGWNDFGVKNDNLFASVYLPIGASRRLSIKRNSIRVSNVPAYEQAQESKRLRRRQGVGAMMTSRTIGPYKASTITANYSYHLPISKAFTLAMGVKAGYVSQRIDFNGYTVRDASDPFYNQIMSSNAGIKNTAQLDFGSVLYSSRFYLAVSTANLVSRAIDGDKLWSINSQRQIYVHTAYTALLGLNYELNTGVKVTATEGYPISYAVNSRIRYHKFIYAGVGYDKTSKISFLFGMNVKGNLSLNYSYDHYLTNAGTLNVSVHELVLGIGLRNKYGSAP